MGTARRKAGVEYDLALAWATARAPRTIDERNIAAVLCKMEEIVGVFAGAIVGDVGPSNCWLCLSERATQARAASAGLLTTANPNLLRKFAPHDQSPRLCLKYLSQPPYSPPLSFSNPSHITGKMSGILGSVYKYAPATRAGPLG